MESFARRSAKRGEGRAGMPHTGLNLASPGIDCFLGDSTYRVSDCEAKILCGGHPGQECTQFNGDAAQYTVYILKVAYCTETIPVETAYLEKFVESTGQWQQMGTHSAGGYNGWTWISWIIYPNHTTERWRIRWGNCTKEWKHVAACQPNWQCEPGQTGWEIDGCGNKRENSACNPIIAKPKIIDASPKTPITVNVNEQIDYKATADQAITKWYWNFTNPGAEGVQGANIETTSDTFTKAFSSPGEARIYALGQNANGYTDWLTWFVTVAAAACIPSWVCETPLNGSESDGCGNKRLNPACNPPSAGIISISSSPSGARVYLDGVDKTVTTPAILTGVSSGSYIVKLALAGYQDATQTVIVTAGQVTPVGFALIPVCAPSWVCEIGQTGWEIDGCGNRRQNPACAAVQPSGAGVYLAISAAVVTGVAAVAILSRRK